MKYATGVLALIGCNADSVLHRSVRQAGPGDDRRYFQLVDMMEHYNPEFDERKYWTYGCQCLMLGDRAMSDPGHGHPISPLDATCKEYKDCQRCARDRFGDQCIGEFVKYRYGERNGEKVCKNQPDTCERALCECDLQFAKHHVETKDSYSDEYHMFWSTSGWDPEDPSMCYPQGTPPYIPKCCGVPGSPFVLFNAANKKCCNGEVKKEC